MENLKIDENSRWVLGAVTNDGNNEIRNARVNPVTGALIVEATVTSTNTQIGSTIPGGTAGSVLFLGLGGTLSQDNANFFYDDTNNFLGLGTNTPNAMLDVQGSAIITGSTGTPTFVLGRDGSGNLSNIVLGANLTLTGGVLSANTAGATGYDQIQDDGTNVTQRTTLNFVDYFTVTDASSKTNVSINTAELGADTTLISTLETNMDLANISGQIDLSTQVTGVLSATNIDITDLESNLDLANIAGQIDLSTQVTGQLSPTNIDLLALASDTTFITALEPNLDLANIGGQIDLTTQVTGVLSLANGGTGQSLTDPNYDAVYVWDNTTNTTRLAQLSGLSYNSGTNTLTNTGGSGSMSGGSQTVEYVLSVGNFTDTNCAYNATDGSIWEWNSTASTITRKYILNTNGVYQAVQTPSYNSITAPIGFGFGTVAPVIYNNNMYLLAYAPAGGISYDVKFKVIDLSTGTTLGDTNVMINTFFSPDFPASACGTNDGSIIFATAFNGFKHFYQSDITSPLVLTAATSYTTNASQPFTGNSSTYASYKKTKTNTNIAIATQYYNYGTATNLDGIFSVDSKVIFWGTTSDNKTIIGRLVFNTNGNPGNQPGTYLIISYWDTIGSTTGTVYNL